MKSVKKMLPPIAAVMLLATMALTQAAFAQTKDYPTRPVRIIVPFAPGGATDFVARFMAQQLTQRMGQSFIVENRTGAGGVIAIDAVAKAQPDGYILLVASGSYAVNPAVMKMPFDPVEDLRPVVNIVAGPASFLVRPDLPIHSLKELVEYAKARPGAVTFASAGVGNTTHVAMEAFAAEAGIKMVHSPYKGMAPALLGVAKGEADVILSDTGSAVPLISAGKLRLIAVGGDKRLPQFPDVPSVVEAGYREVLAAPWQGMFAPKGTPDTVIRALNAQVNDVLNSKDMPAQLARRFFMPMGGTSAEFGATVRSDIASWEKVARAAHVKIE